jgi:hypothetical protein
MRRWLWQSWTTRLFAFRVQRAVSRFNRMMPQQRLVVFIQLLRDHPELARQFRRALQMDDARPERSRIDVVRAWNKTVPRR